jgi:hypothetical protein
MKVIECHLMKINKYIYNNFHKLYIMSITTLSNQRVSDGDSILLRYIIGLGGVVNGYGV